jgi:parvulin-like peptidyl-prolyl isomerase
MLCLVLAAFVAAAISAAPAGAAASTSAPAAAPAPASDSDVLAVVNSQPITRGALLDRFLNLTNTGRDMLNEMIGETLLLQEAKKRNLTVTDQEVQERIALIQSRLPGATPEEKAQQFQRYLADQNVTPAGLNYKLKMKLMAEKVLADKIQVTDQDVETIYQARKGLYDVPEHVVLSWIRVKTEADAKGVLDRLSKGESFADVAKAVSTDLMSRPAGGHLGEAARTDLPDELQGPAFSTDVGKYTQPIKTINPETKEVEYAILMIEQKSAAKLHDPQFIRESIRMALRENKLKGAYLDLMQTLSKQSKIENKLAPGAP